jgi:deazaflavin-dependent oxidoreductase (nitroreductase family)
MADRYVRPDWFTVNVFNRIVAWLTRIGVSVYGSRVLAVRGRKSGEWRTTPVNVLIFHGERYLLAPRGVTEWVRNIRVSGTGELRVGSRREPISVVEIPDAEKPPILRAYLKKWAFEVGIFFEGVGADAPDSKLLEAAPKHPVFRLTAPRR